MILPFRYVLCPSGSFNSDRIAKHIGACEKAHKARKPFNAAERRQVGRHPAGSGRF